MTFAQRPLLIAVLALMCGGVALAADAPKADAKKEEKADDKKDAKDGKEAKADAPAEPDLPSKPYPKNAQPKAFAPKAELKKFDEPGAAKPADKVAEKGGDKMAEKGGDKGAEKGGDKPADKSADKAAVAAYQPAHDKPAMKKRRQAAAPVPVTDPALAALARESLDRNAPAAAYQVKAGENLDAVIRKTMPASPFSLEVMREAFARANPQLLAAVKAMKLKAGSTLNVPDAAVMRQVVLGDAAPPAAPAEPAKAKPSELYQAAPVVAPSAPATTSDQNPPIAIPRLAPDLPAAPVAEVAPEEKKRWVRYP
ncbi:MAG: hypothetical protein NBV65_04285 [Burkholderiaceae bacterium]|nr:hypothetical protein [Burkholderiaceae bacterium]